MEERRVEYECQIVMSKAKARVERIEGQREYADNKHAHMQHQAPMRPPTPQTFANVDEVEMEHYKISIIGQQCLERMSG